MNAKAVAIPAIIASAVAGYVVISGLTGFCPTCERIVDSALGRDAARVSLNEGGGSIAGLAATDLDGRQVSLEQFVGKPTVLELWATWCPPCRAQRSIMETLAPELEGRLNLVSLSTDASADIVRRYLEGHTAIGAELMATPEVVAAMGNPIGIPALGFVDARGELVEVRMGVQDASVIREWIEKGG